MILSSGPRAMLSSLIRTSGATLTSGVTRVRVSAAVNGALHTSAVVTDREPVPLTGQRYAVARGDYGRLEPADLQHFRALLDPERVLTAADELAGYNTDWWRSCRGESGVVLKPRNTAEVSAILSHCHARTLAVCPQGGNTAVVGSGVPVFDEIILSTQLMNRVLDFDSLTGVLQCEAGCVLQMLQQYLAERGHLAPLDLGAKGSCQIGGNLATNAGGLQMFRYGSLHANVLGIEVVLANGEIVDLMSTMMKNNTGYDLKHLFIGSEGTLGVITRVSIRCPVKANSVNLAFLGVESFDKVLEIYSQARRQLSEVLSSCEFIDHESMQSANENLSLSSPLSGRHECYMLLETSGGSQQHDEEKLITFLESAVEQGLVTDGTIASSSREMQAIWTLRESLPEALMHDGHSSLYDVSLPLASFYQCVDHLRREMAPFGSRVRRICGFGHLGDGNIHVNVSSGSFDAQLEQAAEQQLFSWTAARGGSISAEHGIGFKKRQLLYLARAPAAVALMRQMKRTLDPRAILNPYKVLPDQPATGSADNR